MLTCLVVPFLLEVLSYKTVIVHMRSCLVSHQLQTR